MKKIVIAATALLSAAAFAADNTAIGTAKTITGNAQAPKIQSVRFIGPEAVGRVLDIYKTVPAELAEYRADIVLSAAVSGKNTDEIISSALELKNHRNHNSKYALSAMAISGGGFAALNGLTNSMSWCPSEPVRFKLAYAVSALKKDTAPLSALFKTATPSFAQDKALLAMLADDKHPMDILNQAYAMLRYPNAKGAAVAAMVMTNKRPDEINQLGREIPGHEYGFDSAQLIYVCAVTGKTPQKLRDMRKRLNAQGKTTQTLNRLTLLAALLKTDITYMDMYASFFGNTLNKDKEALTFAAAMFDANDDTRKEAIRHLAISQFFN